MHHTKVSLVQRKDIQAPVALRQYDDGGVGKPQLQVSVLPYESAGVGNVLVRERFQLVRSARHITQQLQLFSLSAVPCNEVVELGQNKW
jgi:hypothetical protein